MTRLFLISASDDFLLEEALRGATTSVSDTMGAPEIVELAPSLSPEDVAVEVNSPSLFNPERILVAPDVRGWVKAPAPPGGVAAKEVDPAPLVRALDGGVPDGVALILGVWCNGRPTGPLVDAVDTAGQTSWIPSPEPPKPWEDVVVSQAQREVLRRVVAKAAPDARLAPAAEKLLLERLGFAPRQLAQESAKLAAAAGVGGVVDEALVRRLVLPREGSLEVLQDAVLARDAKSAAHFLDQVRRGIPICDWSGKRLAEGALALRSFNLAADTFLRMLYLRRIARAAGVEGDLDPRRCDARQWYSKTFKPKIYPKLQRLIEGDEGAPFGGRSGAVKPWGLHRLFRGAARYSEPDLVEVLMEAGRVERMLRRSGDLAAPLPGWVLGALGESAA